MEKLHKFLSRFHLKTGGRLFGFGNSPESDWKVILIFTLVLLVAVLVTDTFIFLEVNKDKSSVVKDSISSKEKILDVLLLRKTVSYYQNKMLEFDLIKNSPTAPPDPSI